MKLSRWFLLGAALAGLSYGALAENDVNQMGLTDQEIADIDHQLEQLRITRAQAVAPEDNANIDRKPGIIAEPEVDSGLGIGN